ncbi:hypothetical protein QFZ77_003225 [Paenibacillus sp. V4I3]|nr:hypothetical protein [Paenibacillus sp. V4I3]
MLIFQYLNAIVLLVSALSMAQQNNQIAVLIPNV